MLEELGNPSVEEIAKALDISTRTVRQWKRQGYAPKAAMMCLFWLTHWGQQRVDVDLYNYAQLQHGMACSLRLDVRRLEATIAHLLTIADFGAANDPSTSFGDRASNPAARISHARTRTRNLSCLTPVVQPDHLATVEPLPSAPRNDTPLTPASL